MSFQPDSILSTGTVPFAANQSMGSHKLTNVTDPSAAQDAATKNYVDTVASGLNPIQAVSFASASTNYPGTMVGNVLTITATGAISIDGSTPSAGQRILLKNQTTQAQNGVYVVTTVGSGGVSPVLTRAADYNTAADVNAGDLVPVISGTVNATTSWLQTATVVTLNTDSLVFAQWTANPANYLLKANNLSDVSTPATAFNNISPMTTGGDVIYGGASGVGTRLANGSNGQVLTSGGGTAAPSWTSVAGVTSANARYHGMATALSGLTVLVYTTKDFDSQVGAYVSGLYTIGTTGKYQINASIQCTGTWAVGNLATIELDKNTFVFSRNTTYAWAARTGSLQVAISDIFSFTAGDTIRVRANCTAASGGAFVDDDNTDYFSLSFLGT